LSQTPSKDFQAMNANFCIIAPLEKRIKNKKERNMALARRALDVLESRISD